MGEGIVCETIAEIHERLVASPEATLMKNIVNRKPMAAQPIDQILRRHVHEALREAARGLNQKPDMISRHTVICGLGDGRQPIAAHDVDAMFIHAEPRPKPVAIYMEPTNERPEPMTDPASFEAFIDAAIEQVKILSRTKNPRRESGRAFADMLVTTHPDEKDRASPMMMIDLRLRQTGGEVASKAPVQGG